MSKQPTAVIWFIHSLEVLALGATVTAVVTLYQAFAAGNFSLATAGVTIASAVGAVLLNGFKGILGNANFAQAIGDLRTELAAAPQPAQPPVIINNHIPGVPAPVTSAVQPVAVQPAPLSVDMQTTQAELEALRKVQ